MMGMVAFKRLESEPGHTHTTLRREDDAVRAFSCKRLAAARRVPQAALRNCRCARPDQARSQRSPLHETRAA
eukprot:1383346-Rhodomonas_salina.7